MMNKKMMMAIGAMAIAAVLGLIFSQNLSVSAGPDLTKAEVEDKVKAQYPGEITELELDNQGKNPVYEVEVVMEEKEYELQIDGNSGKVLKLEEKRATKTAKKNERETDKQKEKADKEDSTATKEKKESDLEMNEKANEEKDDSERKTVIAPKQEETKQEEKQEQATKESNNKSNERKSTISKNKAIDIAQKQFSGTIDSIELDRDDGRLIYEIEMESSRGEAEIEIDAYTGEVLVVDIDLEDD